MMSSRSYTTTEAATAVGITRATLQDWIKKGKCVAPKVGRVGNIRVRFWTASDVAKLRKTKLEIYQEKRR
jgi:excisionase family DNA binding protein